MKKKMKDQKSYWGKKVRLRQKQRRIQVNLKRHVMNILFDI